MGERIRSSDTFDGKGDPIQNQDTHVLMQMDSLEVSEENLRRLTDNMYDVISQIGPSGIILYASPSHKWVLGFEPKEVIGTMVFERLHPEDMAEALTIFSRAVAEKRRPEPFALRYQHADGRYLWMECVGNILTDENGEFAGAVLSSRDITPRKEIEAALRESEQRYRLLADNVDDVIWVRDMNLQQIYISPAVQKLCGFSVEQALNQGLEQTLTPDSAAFAKSFFLKALKQIETMSPEQLKNDYRVLELEMNRKDGSTVWAETQVSFLLDKEGRPTGILGVSRDITERKRAADELQRLNMELEERIHKRTAELVAEIKERKRVEAALRESEERYKLATYGANDGLWDWNFKTNEIYYSGRWKSMLGFEEEEIGDRPEEWFSRIHPDDRTRFHAMLEAHLSGNTAHFESEYRVSNKKGNILWMLSRGLAVRDADGKAYRMAGSQTDITDRKLAEEQLALAALHDPLTELPNRVLFMDRLGQRLEHAKRHPDSLFAVLSMDLDRFKIINDSLGHTVGDTILVSTARKLQSCLRPEDTVCRLGGDEFAVLLNEVNEVGDTIRVADRIQTQLMSNTMLKAVNRSSTASIGVALYQGNYTDPQEMLRDADAAMYRAKALGGGCYQLFNPAMYENALSLLQLEADLKLAVEKQEWQLYYQPVISLESGNINGVEALLRWIHPKRGVISPLDFIPLAEETGLILQIGEYVLRNACAQAKAWRDNGHPKLWVSVNISGRQFQDKSLVNVVEQTLKDTGLAGDGLHLEITESMAMKDLAHSISILNELTKLGVSISLDDFGKGYSSLGYLKHFPLKVLKIDRSFIQDDGINKNNEAITSAIIFMGQTLNLEVVAEGVETEGQLAFLKSQFCDEVQGFLFSQPMPGEELSELLNNKKDFMKF